MVGCNLLLKGKGVLCLVCKEWKDVASQFVVAGLAIVGRQWIFEMEAPPNSYLRSRTPKQCNPTASYLTSHNALLDVPAPTDKPRGIH
jgi:hypothetical protein